jgi:hypothetical protein
MLPAPLKTPSIKSDNSNETGRCRVWGFSFVVPIVLNLHPASAFLLFKGKTYERGSS